TFFFQAEDGIRDLIVTGVQTCALPICARKYFRDLRRDQCARALLDCRRNLRPDQRRGNGGAVTLPAGVGAEINERAVGIGRAVRSEERRVGKEWGYREARD